MGRAFNMRGRKPDVERMPTSHSQSAQIACLPHRVRVCRKGVHLCCLAQALPMVDWRTGTGSVLEYRNYFSGSCSG